MKNLSNNSLNELLELYNRMQTEIHTFSHVSEYVGKSVIRAVKKERNKVITELTVRERASDIWIGYDRETNTYYWEDYHTDTYRQGFKTSKECIKDIDKWVRKNTVRECGTL